MKQQIKLALASLVLVASVGSAQATNCWTPSSDVDTRDVVRDTRGNYVHDTKGNCVRTNWLNSHDLCGKPQAPVATPLLHQNRIVYFAFGKSTLTKEAKQRLATLAADIKARGGVKAVRIAGYADRIGAAAANERLSKKRADSVRKYLMEMGVANIPSVETRWFGDSVATAKCPKNLKKADKIVCLQADRKVEIEVDYIILPPASPTNQ